MSGGRVLVIAARLTEIADELDRIDGERERLYAERLRLWHEGAAEEMPPKVLARCSRIETVTVRQLMRRDG